MACNVFGGTLNLAQSINQSGECPREGASGGEMSYTSHCMADGSLRRHNTAVCRFIQKITLNFAGVVLFSVLSP